jgi:hypothetical protein
MKSRLLLLLLFVWLGVVSGQAQAGKRVISGVVTGADSRPLADVAVAVFESGHAGPSAETTTDAQGRFNFADLPDGRFELVASRRGYARTTYNEHGGVNTAIVTGENLDNTGLVLSLAPLASISGTVTEDSGDPVPQAQIHLFRDDPMRGNAKQPASATNADEMGDFEMSQLAPGTYYLCATGVPWYRPSGQNSLPAADQPRSPLDVAYAPSCYSDTADPAAAQPIQINAGAHIEANLIFHAVPAIRVSFQVPKPRPDQGIQLPQLSQEIFGAKEFVQSVPLILGTPNDQTGGDTVTITLTGLAPGQYEVQIPEVGPNSPSARFGAIQVSSSDFTAAMSTFQAAASISGKILMEGGGQPPEGSMISLFGDEEGPVSSGVVQPDGTFHFPGAPPGDYEIRISGSHGLLAVSRLKVNGVASRSSTLHLGSDPIELTIMASASSASVSGSVVRNGKPTSGVFVLLVPENLNAGIAAWIVNQSDSDGTFVSDNVPPGRYTAVAIDQGWTLDWRRPEVISPYLAHGVEIVIPSGSRSAALKSPLEAQPSVAPLPPH